MFEMIFKISVQAVFIFLLFFVSSWLWRTQIDIKTTFIGFLKRHAEKPIDWIATRDPNAIYQNEAIVGNITGTVRDDKDTIFFAEICNTGTLDVNNPIEYRRYKLKIMQIGTTLGLMSSASSAGSAVKQNVKKDVVCQKI